MRSAVEASGVVEAIGQNIAGLGRAMRFSVVSGSISMASYGAYGEVADMPAKRLTRNPD